MEIKLGIMDVTIRGKLHTFKYSGSSECWMSSSKITIVNTCFDVELYLNDFPNREIRWDELSEFFSFLEVGVFCEVKARSEVLLMALVDAIGWFKPTSHYRLELACIQVKGKAETLMSSAAVFRYSLIFGLFAQDCVETDDPYGNYIVDVEDAMIVGCRREQV